jgi:tripartite-type tricarboxylate transporter receptor subunit TctC
MLRANDLQANRQLPGEAAMMVRVVGLSVAVLLAAESAAFAQPTTGAQYPNQMVRIVVPFSAGSNTDGQARIIADKLSDLWKQQVIVENRPGVAGTASVTKAAPDGYTLMLTSSGHPVANVINRAAPFDPVKDFAGVTQTTGVPAALIVPPDFPAKTVSDFIALARQKPGGLNFASAGTASTSYLAGEVFKQVAKIDIVHIPHKGAPEAMTSILRNDSQLYFASANSTTELIEAKKIGVIAVSSGKRFPPLPNVPTVKEAGLAGYEYDSWFGVLAPTGVPKPVLNKVSQDIARVLRMPDVAEKMKSQGLVVATQSPDEFDALIKSEADRYGKILREAGVGTN